MKNRQVWATVVLAALACTSAQAGPFTLTDGESMVAGNTCPVGSSVPVMLNAFSVPPAGGEPAEDSLFRNDVFIDDGTSVRRLNSLPALAFAATATTLDASFDGGTFQVDLAYDLDASGFLSETITISAISAVTLRVWDYTDFDVAGTLGSDTATLITPSQMSQVDSVANVTASVAVTTPVPDAFEIGEPVALVTQVAAGVDLCNVDGGAPSSDKAFAFQWNFVLAASETAGIVKTRFVTGDATGACTVAAPCNDNCFVTAIDACAGVGGTYLGDDSSCPSANPSGACCTGEGMCVQTCAADCSVLAGSYFGDGSICPTEDVGFGDTDSMGAWTLDIVNTDSVSSGTWADWSIEINGASYSSATLSFTIMSGTGNELSDTISVPDSISITNVDVTIGLSHTSAHDLMVSITGPTGLTRLLTNCLGGTNHLGDMGNPTEGTPVNYTFSDSGTQNWTDAAVDPIPAGVYSPIEPLSTFAIEPCADTNCVCEFDGDAGAVDVEDLLAFLALWFVSDTGADLNGGGVDVTDLLEFLACWLPASANGTCA